VTNAINRWRVDHEWRLADVPPRPNAAMRCSVFGSRLVGKALQHDRSVSDAVTVAPAGERRAPNTAPLIVLVARFGSWLPNRGFRTT
jgi:hypothetical protein